MIEQRDGSVLVRIRAHPRAARTEIAGMHDGALKVRVAAPPADGAANDELIRFIAKRVSVASSRVWVRSGGTGRTKVLEIEGAEAEAVRRALLG